MKARKQPRQRSTSAARVAEHSMDRDTALLARLHQTNGEAAAVAAANVAALAYMQRGDSFAARRLLDVVLRYQPEDTDALLMLATATLSRGAYDEALALAERALRAAPENLGLLLFQVRALFMVGRLEEAAARTEALLGRAGRGALAFSAAAEALSLMGWDQRILDLRAEVGTTAEETAHGCHYCACAALGLGDEAEARRLWQRALELDPTLGIASENLHELELPPGERHCPWPFSTELLLKDTPIGELRRLEAVLKGKPPSSSRLRAAYRDFFAQHPALVARLPFLLQRGGPFARELALSLALHAGGPSCWSALRDFATGTRGPVAPRLEAYAALIFNEQEPPGLKRVWDGEGWDEMFPIGFVVDDTPTHVEPGEAQRIQEQAAALIRRNESAQAEPLLRRAAALKPEASDITYNLAVSLMLQQREDEAMALVRAVHARDPDYFFARIALARAALAEGRLDEAKELVEPLRRLKRVHNSEFGALMGFDVELAIEQRRFQRAEHVLKVLEHTLPGYHTLPGLRALLDRATPPLEPRRW